MTSRRGRDSFRSKCTKVNLKGAVWLWRNTNLTGRSGLAAWHSPRPFTASGCTAERGAIALRTEALLWIAVELRNLAVLLPELDVVTIDELLGVLFRSLVVRACQLDCSNKSAITSNYVNPVPGHLLPFGLAPSRLHKNGETLYSVPDCPFHEDVLFSK
jgi:hypothetical protein